MINIVLDSSVYCRDFAMEGASFALLWRALRAVGGRIVVPAMVEIEVQEQHRKKLVEAIDRVSRSDVSAAKRASNEESFRRRWLKGQDGEVARFANVAFVPLASMSYAEHFRTRLTTDGFAEFPSLPPVSHEELAARCAAHRKPFGSEGRGYGDALIWYSILETLRDGAAPVHLITSNTNDFMLDGALHPDLVADLIARGISAQAVVVHSDMNLFFGHVLNAIVRPAEQFARSLVGSRTADESLRAWTSAHLFQVADRADVTYYLHPFDSDLVTVRSRTVRSIERVSVTAVYQFEDGRAFVVAAISVCLEFEVEGTLRRLRRDAHLGQQIVADPEGPDADEDEVAHTVLTDGACEVSLVFAFDTSTGEIVEADICKITGGIANWHGPHPMQSETWETATSRRARSPIVIPFSPGA